jgi:hypothetical protein
MTTHINL